jgi:hypothetical protein
VPDAGVAFVNPDFAALGGLALLGAALGCTTTEIIGSNPDAGSGLDSSSSDAVGADCGASAADGAHSAKISLIQAKATDALTASVANVELPAPVRSSDTIVVGVYVDDPSASVATISDACKNDYEPQLSPFSPYHQAGATYYLAASVESAGGCDSVTVELGTSGQQSFEVFVLEYAGLSSPEASAVNSGTAPNGTTVSGASVEVPWPNLLILGWVESERVSPGKGFTSRLASTHNLIEDELVPCPGSYGASATIEADASSAAWTVILKTFRGQ